MMHGSMLDASTAAAALGQPRPVRRGRRPGSVASGSDTPSTHSRGELSCGGNSSNNNNSNPAFEFRSSGGVASMLSEFAGDGQSHISTLLRSKSLGSTGRPSRRRHSHQQFLPDSAQPTLPQHPNQQPRYRHPEDSSTTKPVFPLPLLGFKGRAQRSNSLGAVQRLRASSLGDSPFLFDQSSSNNNHPGGALPGSGTSSEWLDRAIETPAEELLPRPSPAAGANFEKLLQSLSGHGARSIEIDLHRDVLTPESSRRSVARSMEQSMESTLRSMDTLDLTDRSGTYHREDDDDSSSSSSSSSDETASSDGSLLSGDSSVRDSLQEDEDSTLDDGSLDDTSYEASYEETLGEWDSVEPPPPVEEEEATDASSSDDDDDDENGVLIPTKAASPQPHDDDSGSTSISLRQERQKAKYAKASRRNGDPLHSSDHELGRRDMDKLSPAPSFASDHGRISSKRIGSHRSLASWSESLTRSRNSRFGPARKSDTNMRASDSNMRSPASLKVMHCSFQSY